MMENYSNIFVPIFISSLDHTDILDHFKDFDTRMMDISLLLKLFLFLFYYQYYQYYHNLYHNTIIVFEQLSLQFSFEFVFIGSINVQCSFFDKPIQRTDIYMELRFDTTVLII